MVKFMHRMLPGKRQEQMCEPLCFAISECSGEAVDKRTSGIPGAVLKRGASYIYALDNPARSVGISSPVIGQAKSAVIDELSSSDEDIGIHLMGKARELASYELHARGIREPAVADLIAHDVVGYGPISILMEDKASIEEIEINSPTSEIEIYHAVYGRCRTNLRFLGAREFRSAVNRLAYSCEKELNERYPIIDVQEGDARLHAQLSPYALTGASATIRLEGSKDINISSMVSGGTANPEILAYLWMAMDCGMNIVVGGAPATGKTTMLSVILSFAGIGKRAITIEEDVNEFRLNPAVISAVPLCGSRQGKVSTKEQAINALRMRPDILVIGEIRGNEARELFSSAGIGVQFLTTMHCSDAGMQPLRKLVLKPLDVDQRSLAGLDMCLFMKQETQSRKTLCRITEYSWLSRAETENLGGTLLDSGDSVRLLDTVIDGRAVTKSIGASKVVSGFSSKYGITRQQAVKELERRSGLISSICSRGMTTLEIIAELRNR